MSVQTPKNSSLLEEVKRPIRMLALGDSYTIGEGVSQSLSWPIQLRDALQAKGYLIEEFTTLAQTGWTTSDLLTAINANNPTGSFDLVTLLIGVNNQYQAGDIEIYRTEFRTLLGLAAKFAGRDPSKILVISIPDWGGTPFNKDRDPHKISAGIDQFNMVIHRECLAAEIQTLDITCLSRQAPADPAMLAPDGLHPSGELYALWVELILPNTLKILPPIQKGNAMQFSTEPSLANHLDEQDPLALFREKFVISDLDTIYLDGNSLGRLPVATISHLQDAIERQWGQRLIRVWNEGWNDTPRTLGDKIAQLIGAQPGEVIVTDSTSANLFKLAVAALRARPGSLKIVSDTLNFPSDLYIFQGIIDLLGRGHQLALIPSHDDVHIQLEDVEGGHRRADCLSEFDTRGLQIRLYVRYADDHWISPPIWRADPMGSLSLGRGGAAQAQ